MLCILTNLELAIQPHQLGYRTDFGKTIVLTTQCSQTAISSVHFPWFLIAVACLTRPLT